jgi:hypothetical protein
MLLAFGASTENAPKMREATLSWNLKVSTGYWGLVETYTKMR